MGVVERGDEISLMVDEGEKEEEGETERRVVKIQIFFLACALPRVNGVRGLTNGRRGSGYVPAFG